MNLTNWVTKSKTYDGRINRDYEGLPKFSISYPGKIPYTISSKKSLEQLKELHKGAVVTRLLTSEERHGNYLEGLLENYH